MAAVLVTKPVANSRVRAATHAGTVPRAAARDRPAALHHLRLGRRRQEHADRPPAARHAPGVRRPALGRRQRQPPLGHHRRSARSRACWSTACRPSASRASPSTWRIAISRRRKRKFIVADCPGHEQYTRNMATGASTADAAVVLVDAEKGVRVQTRRHTHIVSLLGVQNVILAVNKMDRIDYDKARFEAIAGEFVAYAHKLGVHERRSDPGRGADRRERGAPRHQGNALVHRPHAARGARRHRSRRAPTCSRNCASRSSS